MSAARAWATGLCAWGKWNDAPTRASEKRAGTQMGWQLWETQESVLKNKKLKKKFKKTWVKSYESKYKFFFFSLSLSVSSRYRASFLETSFILDRAERQMDLCGEAMSPNPRAPTHPYPGSRIFHPKMPIFSHHPNFWWSIRPEYRQVIFFLMLKTMFRVHVVTNNKSLKEIRNFF